MFNDQDCSECAYSVLKSGKECGLFLNFTVMNCALLTYGKFAVKSVQKDGQNK